MQGQCCCFCSHVTLPSTPATHTTPTPTTTTHAITFSSEISPVTYPGLQIHFIPVEKHSILMLYFPSPNATTTIIFSHGNATDCGAMFNYYARIANTLQVNVVAYDYSGYGASGGAPSEKQTYLDITAVYNHTLTLTKTAILLYGQSVGSGPSCYLASIVPIAGMILHSPILSGVRVLTDSRLLACWDIYPNLKYIQRVNSPVFIIHGQEDAEVHIGHGEALQQLEYRSPPWWVPDRGHNDVLEGNEKEYFKRLKSFLAHVEKFHSSKE